MIITSLLDTDLYKFTMMQAVLHQFPGAQVEYRFKCRNPGLDPASGQAMRPLAPYVSEIRAEIEPLPIVIKMVRCNGQPVAKLSDSPSKDMCDDEKYLAYQRQVFDIVQTG